jgi:hypothetical protein
MDSRGSIASRDKIFLRAIESRPALGLNKPQIQQVPGTISQGAKRPVSETVYSPKSSAEVKNGAALPSISLMFHGIALN